MIRVAYVVDHLHMGGAQRHLLQVAAGLDKEVYEPEIWSCAAAPGELAERFHSLGVPVHSFGIESTLISPRTLAACRRVASQWRNRGIQIVHGYLFEGNLLGALAGRLARCPVVIASKRSLDRYKRRDHLVAAWLTNYLAHRVTVNAEAVRDLIIEHERCPADKIINIPNGVPLGPAQDSTTTPAGSKHGLQVGMVGRLGWKKGYEHALRAFAQVTQRHPESRLDIIGDGDLREELPALARELGLADRVRFLGQRDDVAERMRGFDCYVLSSVIEGMPNALLEAMAQGCAAVTTSAGGSGEVVEDGKSGLVVPPGDADRLAEAISRVLQDPVFAQELGTAARERVFGRFSEPAMLQALDSLYREELARAGFKEKRPQADVSSEAALSKTAPLR
jgi:glycosyltransferase involved in cell wall biosynthesis